MSKKIGLILFSGVILLLAACAPKAPPEPLELTIEMSEYAFSPADLEFQVGQEVTLHLKNIGKLDHEIMFGRDMMTKDSRPNGYIVDMFETAGFEPEVMMMESEHDDDGDEHDEGEEHMDEDHAGFMVFVPTGDGEYTMTFTVTEEMEGQWEIGCFELDGVHYTSGMVGTLNVLP